ncbi:MAG: hypothetical protein GY831_15985, partial [Delftia sp.]|nr:hypothetical protein [Delftia sp.]
MSTQPRFFWRDDVPLAAERRGLPAYFCRECGHSGWLAVRRAGDTRLTDDPRSIYRHYFERHRNTHYVYPRHESGGELWRDRLCPHCLGLSFGEHCRDCDGAETIPVRLHHQASKPRGVKLARDLQRCPVCSADNALSIVGSGAASLSSVAISHLYTSPLNDDKKLLAFTDSVQDASHRAAFFGARTYRFNLRTAFQSLLQSTDDESIPLDAFTERLLEHWLDAWQDDAPSAQQKLVAAFMPPDLRAWSAYRRFNDGPPGPIPPGLRRDLHQRLSWEVTMEYGFNARVGRSLEKVGSSTAYLAPAQLDAALEALALILPEEIGLLRDADPAAIRHTVTGLLERTRTRGGVDHPLLRRYVQEQGQWYLLTKRMQPLLSPFSRRSPRFPRFLTDTHTRDVFDLYITAGARHTWYIDWAQRSLSSALGQQDINEIYRLVIPRLVDAGILVAYRKGQARAYGLAPSALLVTRHTARLRCGVCGRRQTVGHVTLDHWQGRACLSYRCPGRYQPDTRSEQGYYRAVYERGQVQRIFTAEHTGLLERETREAIETGFKEQARADDANLLAATPTLEMGIDIGDLSATLACAVPPS